MKQAAKQEANPPERPCKKTKKSLLTNQFEFSKIIVRRGLFIFLIQLVLSLAIIFFKVESAAYSVSLMNAAVPLYAVIFGGYFGKAGLENYQKIKGIIDLDRISCEAECEEYESREACDEPGENTPDTGGLG